MILKIIFGEVEASTPKLVAAIAIFEMGNL